MSFSEHAVSLFITLNTVDLLAAPSQSSMSLDIVSKRSPRRSGCDVVALLARARGLFWESVSDYARNQKPGKCVGSLLPSSGGQVDGGF